MTKNTENSCLDVDNVAVIKPPAVKVETPVMVHGHATYGCFNDLLDLFKLMLQACRGYFHKTSGNSFSLASPTVVRRRIQTLEDAELVVGLEENVGVVEDDGYWLENR
uniref:Uncharacterized protein n=1 Tax=Romanomermis culicivorax TaxID=13658 RepID=A0A915J3U2_ROMCU